MAGQDGGGQRARLTLNFLGKTPTLRKCRLFPQENAWPRYHIGKGASFVGSFSPNLGVDALGVDYTRDLAEPPPLLQKFPAVSIGSLKFGKRLVQLE
jgi:hypothetical protein